MCNWPLVSHAVMPTHHYINLHLMQPLPHATPSHTRSTRTEYARPRKLQIRGENKRDIIQQINQLTRFRFGGSKEAPAGTSSDGGREHGEPILLGGMKPGPRSTPISSHPCPSPLDLQERKEERDGGERGRSEKERRPRARQHSPQRRKGSLISLSLASQLFHDHSYIFLILPTCTLSSHLTSLSALFPGPFGV